MKTVYVQGQGGHLNAVDRMFMKTTLLHGLNYEQNEVRVRNTPSCVLTSGISSRVKTREALPMSKLIGSLYAWFRLVVD